MLYVVYLDEFGHIGPYIGHDDPRRNTHPGGMVLPYPKVRQFSTFFFQLKNRLLELELERSCEHPAKWEKKGSSLYTNKNIAKYRELRQATNRLLKQIHKINGFGLYVGVEKRRTEQGHDSKKLYHSVLREVIKRIDQECEVRHSKCLLVLDQHEENVMRAQIVETASIEMFGVNARNRLIEPPMQVESHLYQTVQCADWLCGIFGRLAFHECDPESKPDNEIAERYLGSRIRNICTRSGLRRLK